MRLRADRWYQLASSKEAFLRRVEEAPPFHPRRQKHVRQFLSEDEAIEWLGELHRRAEETDNVTTIRVNDNMSDSEVAALFRERKALVQGFRQALGLLVDLAFDKPDQEEEDGEEG